jgi:hypothetical protein
MGLLINGQVGWRTAAVIGAPAAASTLWTSVYGVWNADTLGTSLDTSIYAVYNGDNVNDSSGNSRNGTNVNNVTFTTGKVGNAFTFNGSNYVGLPTNSLSLTSFSFNFWIFNPSVQSNTIFSDYGNDGQQKGIYIDLTNGNSHTIRLVAFNNSTNYTVVSAGGNSGFINRWSMATITFSGTSVNIYLDGSLVSTGTMPNAINYVASSFPCIGAFKSNNGTPSGYLSSGTKLDAFTIWNRALTANEVLSLYNEGTGAEYPFSSQLLPSLNDATPNANNGTRPASTLTGGVPGPSFTTGKIGKAFTFDGINDYVSLPDNSLNLTSKFSYSFWIKSNDTTNYGVVVGNVQSPRTPYGFFHGYEIAFDLGKYFFFFRSGINTQYIHYTTNVVNNGNWNHIVVTYDPTNLTTGAKIYVNGTLNIQGNTLGTSNPIGYSSPMKPCIGARNHSGSPVNFLPNGTSLDALSAWNKELTQADVTELYNAGTGKQYPN